MKYINDSITLKSEFVRLMKEYQHYYWMVAWAGKPFALTEELCKHAGKIKEIAIGLHFYQTHPNFIERFLSTPAVRYMAISSGTFHPKVYLFANDQNDWEAFIGSANFTNAAFHTNNEAGIIIKGNENNSHLYYQIRKSISEVWISAKQFDKALLSEYRKQWEIQQPRLDLLGRFENKQKPGHLYFSIPVVARTWKEYLALINAQKEAQILERIKVLDLVQLYFRESEKFAEMDPIKRKRIGGYVWADQPADFRLFGTMQNAAKFKQIINANPVLIGQAIDAIPLTGDVTKNHYQKFVKLFQDAVEGGNKYRSGTRLLAMKRPDIFFAISTGNNQLLAQDFQITSVHAMDFERYWDEIVDRIRSSHWYQFPNPKNKLERKIAEYKAAFIDVLYYQQR